jgi:FtsH-binding integral membrane protein
MEKYILRIFSLLLILIITIFFIYKKAYPNNKLTCKNYILNTYLYIILSIIIVSIVVLLIDKNKIKNKIINSGGSKLFWILFIFTLGFLFLTLYINPKNTFTKHIVWLLFIISIGITMYPIYLYTKMSNVFLSTLITTLIIVIGLTLIAFYKPELISLSWGTMLLSLLVIGIILLLCNIFLNKNIQSQNKLGYILSYGFVILFSFLILYDTKKLQVNAKKCIIPDYINESVGIFLDIINIFANMGRINSV